MRSCSADRRVPARGGAAGGAEAPDASSAAAGEAPALGRWGRLVLATLLVGAALIGPAAGFASAKFGDTATVSITITITPTDGAAPTSAPSDAPTAAVDEPAPLP